MNTSVGLVLSGGGARAAYQVGVLKAVAGILGPDGPSPFPIVTGTSAGALNATLLASESHRFGTAVDCLEALWRGLTSAQVHELGLIPIVQSSWCLLRAICNDGMHPRRAVSILNNAPLRDYVSAAVDFDRVRKNLAQGCLRALGVSALNYDTGRSHCFFQHGGAARAWCRARREGTPAEIGLEHLLASSAIPGIYPAVPIGSHYYGDGALRQNAPLSPAIKLGADRLFVIGVSHNAVGQPPGQVAVPRPPSLARMAGHLLNGSFLDDLEEDVERLQRINGLIAPQSSRGGLRSIDVLSIQPSMPFDALAAQWLPELPRSMRVLFGMLGANSRGSGASLASYLLFEPGFIGALVELGQADGMAERSAIEAFFSAPRRV